MAFNLSMCKFYEDRKDLQHHIRVCFKKLSDFDILTDNVKYALRQYITYNIKNRAGVNVDWEKLYPMIEEMLEFCCGKPIISISRKDVGDHECLILSEIKRATEKNITKTLIPSANVTEYNNTILTENEEKLLEFFKGL